MTDTIMIFTVESFETIRQQSGSQYWRINTARAREKSYLLAVQNKRKATNERENWQFATGDAPQGSGFLLGKIIDVVPTDDPTRRRIVVSEIAHIDLPNIWPGDRSPILYRDLATFGIDPDKLTWVPVPPVAATMATEASEATEAAKPVFDIEIVKANIAAAHHVPLASVTITIRL
jgi:hypothetical protein